MAAEPIKLDPKPLKASKFYQGCNDPVTCSFYQLPKLLDLWVAFLNNFAWDTSGLSIAITGRFSAVYSISSEF